MGLLGQHCLRRELGCRWLLVSQEGVAGTRPSCPRPGAEAGLQYPSRLVCDWAADSGGGVKTESGGLSPPGGRRHRSGHHGDRPVTGQGVWSPPQPPSARHADERPGGPPRGRPPLLPGPFPRLHATCLRADLRPWPGASLLPGLTPPPPDDPCWVPVTQEDAHAHACQARFLFARTGFPRPC